MTTYLIIDSSGAHGNNGCKTAKKDLSWSGNSYKKPFVAESALNSLFGSIDAQEHIPKTSSANTFDTTLSRQFGCGENNCKTLDDHIFDHLHEIPLEMVVSRGVFILPYSLFNAAQFLNFLGGISSIVLSRFFSALMSPLMTFIHIPKYR